MVTNGIRSFQLPSDRRLSIEFPPAVGMSQRWRECATSNPVLPLQGKGLCGNPTQGGAARLSPLRSALACCGPSGRIRSTILQSEGFGANPEDSVPDPLAEEEKNWHLANHLKQH